MTEAEFLTAVDPFPCGKWPDSYRMALKSRKGDDMSEWPRDLRVREYPDALQSESED